MNYLRARGCAAALAIAVFTLAGCSQQKNQESAATAPPVDPTPEVYRVRFETTKGNFVIEVTRAWAPLAAERFYLLTKVGFWKGQRFFRVLPGELAQFGINTMTSDNAWLAGVLNDEPVRQSNSRGTVVLARPGPHQRSFMTIINLRDNIENDTKGFAPFGKVIFGLDVADSLYSGYGELAPKGNGPDLARLSREGMDYLFRGFPKLDYIRETAFTE